MPNRAPSKKQAAARAVATKKKIKDQAALVKEAREAAQNLPVTDIDEWKQDAVESSGDVIVKMKVPSGKVCQVKRVTLQTFIAKGMIPNALLPMVVKATEEAQGITANEIADILKDGEALGSMLDMADHVVCECMVKPAVTPNEVRDEIAADEALDDDEKKAKLRSHLFADEVELADKMFIFQYCVGGTRDLERFREQSTTALADVADESAVQGSAK